MWKIITVSLGAGNFLAVLHLSGSREYTLFPSNNSLVVCGNQQGLCFWI